MAPRRREFLRAAAGAAAGYSAVDGATGLAAAQSDSEESWPQHHRDAANTGHAPAVSGPVADVDRTWASAGPSGQVFADDNRPTSSPAVVDGTVYVGSNDRYVRALPVADGSERWRYRTGGKVFSSPAVVDGTVYVGSTDGSIYALPTDSGRPAWTFETDGEVRSSPAVVDGTVYVGSTDGAVYALSADDGSERWRFQAGDTVRSSPAVVDGTVYVGSGGDTSVSNPDRPEAGVYALSADDGTERWRVETDGPVDAAPAVADGTVYVGYPGDYDDVLLALDAASGDERWRFTADADDAWGFASPAVADGTVFAAGTALYALDAASGQERWSADPGDRRSSPAVADGAVYLADGDTLYGFDAETGDRLWAYDGHSNDITSSPAVADGTVYVTAADDFLIAVAGEPTTPTPTATPTRTATSTAAPAGGDSSDGGDPENDAAGGDGGVVLPAAGLLAAGLGGGWWWLRRSGDGSGGSDGTTSTFDGPGPASPRRGRSASPSRHSDTADDSGSTPSPRSERSDVADADSGPSPDAGSTPVTPDEATDGFADVSLGTAADAPAPGDDPVERPADGPSTGNRPPGGPPTEIPRAPDVSVAYDALTEAGIIGSGGNADVVRATAPTPDGTVTLAVKKPRLSGTLHTDTVERMLAEAETWDKLDDHDHVVGVVDYGAEPLPWIAMEYMDGGHLGDRAGTMDVQQSLWTALAVTKGVRHAHRRGVAHLDLKPENVLFRSVDGAWDVPKVADWGLSKHLLDHSASVEGVSPHYAAPEQFDESYGSVDDLTDVYQLGAVFYELFTGRPPFEGERTRVVRAVLDDRPRPPSEVADVPAALDDVVLTALAKEKADRYDDIVYLRDALADLYDGE
ncbi:outer membrane protein assembly factor BamB family protein [Haloplanus rallus]|uniref:outer membrane protein assembly factor BamB family protein n=1 Tax=Haloplanus rallus TaxID=1816183 RepID=UPI0018EE89FA|nr:PQQ-binding-like beta-propeller repeat protein [Haloplanus rallus]